MLLPIKQGQKKLFKTSVAVRFNKLIDEKFSINTLITIELFLKIEKIIVLGSLVTDNADIPTIFEYVLVDCMVAMLSAGEKERFGII